MALPEVRGQRVLSAIRSGSSWPVVVRTSSGDFLTKLRGAAQGLPPLIAEIIVAELATTLDLPVPERALVVLDGDVPSADGNDELADLLGRSHGANLGFRLLPGAVDLRADQLALLDPRLSASILWLDGLVMNPDRTAQNTNLLLWHHQAWLIDHGAALAFHYDWAGLSEQSPRETRFDPEAHLLRAQAVRLREVDHDHRARLTREVIAAAVDAVPLEFVQSAFPREDAVRLRGVYAAFLWKRLATPRPFVPMDA